MNDKQRREILHTLVEAFETYALVFIRVAIGTQPQKDLVKQREKLIKVLDAAIDVED
jgi:hypothetical protein